MAEGTQVLGKAGRTRLPVGVTGRSCPSAGVGPRTAARQARPALPRPCRPPLIGAIFQRYFPRSQQRFDNKQKGERKGLTVASPIPSAAPGSGPDTEHKPGFARGGAEANGARMTLAPELGAGRARRLFREHLGMTQCLLLSMRVMSVPRSRRASPSRSAGAAGVLQHSEHGKTARAASKTRPPSPTAATNIAKVWDNPSCFPRDTCSTHPFTSLGMVGFGQKLDLMVLEGFFQP